MTETERTLIGIWERVLNTRPVRRGDHFFSIGGDSLSAVTMMLEVEAAFDVSLTFRIVFEESTLERFANHIDRVKAPKPGASNGPKNSDGHGKPAFVYPLSPHGRGNPVFFAGVDTKMAQKEMWSLDCPLYAVAHWALGKGFAKAKSMEELARIQIAGIRAIQPHGPYRLAGYSFGGVVAFEIAQQLRRAGETIELLFLLDPSEPFAESYQQNMPLFVNSVADVTEKTSARIKRHLRHVFTNPGTVVPYIGFRAMRHWNRICRWPSWEWICYHLVHFYGRYPNPLTISLLPQDRWPAFWYATRQLGQTYHPQPYDGEVLAVFGANQEYCAMWQRLLGATTEVHTIDSHHLEIFDEPALSPWRQLLRNRLEEKS